MKHYILAFTLLIISLVPLPCSAQLFGRAQQAASWSAKAEMTSKSSGIITITAEVSPRWHIYGLTVPKEAPVATEISFVLSGLRLDGKITVSPAPKVKHDEVFGVDVPYWDAGTVTFSQPFKVTDAKNARCNIDITYIGCTGLNCAPPQTVSLPVTIPSSHK